MNDAVLEVLKFVFPSEVIDFFDIVKTENFDNVLHVYFEEKNNPPSNGLKSNGFYEESCINDFPLRDKKVILHIKRKRWVDDVGKSYSNDFQLVALGTRYSSEFAEFLKKICCYVYSFIDYQFPQKSTLSIYVYDTNNKIGRLHFCRLYNNK